MAPRGCWSARTAVRVSPPSSSGNWPPAATPATAEPTRSCWCTSRDLVERPDHDGVHPARLVCADPRVRPRQDQRGVLDGRRAAVGARRSSRPPAFESTTTPRSASAGSPAWSTRWAGSRSARGRRSTTRWRASICPPGASTWTAATRSATSAAGPPRGPTWIAWSTNGSSCRRCCTGWPARRSGSTRGGGTRCRTRRSTR